MTETSPQSSAFEVDIERVEQALTDDAVRLRLTRSLDVDITPLAAFTILSGRTDDADSSPDHQFLLESAAKADSSDPGGVYTTSSAPPDRARFSFIGYDPLARISITDGRATFTPLAAHPIGDRYDLTELEEGSSMLTHLREMFPDTVDIGWEASRRHRLDGGLVGFVAYEAVHDLWLDGAPVERPDSLVPDASFVVNTKTIAFDHQDDTITLVMTPYIRPGADLDRVLERAESEVSFIEERLSQSATPVTGPFEIAERMDGPRDDYEAAVEGVRDRIAEGEVYQTVISRSSELTGQFDPFELYRALQQTSPSPYMYHLEFDDFAVIGASPETLVTVANDGDRRRVVANPIAGTAGRGGLPTNDAPDPVEDRRLAGELLADPKERAEHTMLVDLARNDLRRVCRGGSVEVTEFMAVRKYSHVQHIESEVIGELAQDADVLDALRSLFPAGTLTGAPKHRSMELINELEPDARGVYGGGVGYLSWNGEADLAIVIRTATIRSGTPDRLTIRAGAGIVAASDPAREFEETESKLDGLRAAIELASGEDTSVTEVSTHDD